MVGLAGAGAGAAARDGRGEGPEVSRLHVWWMLFLCVVASWIVVVLWVAACLKWATPVAIAVLVENSPVVPIWLYGVVRFCSSVKEYRMWRDAESGGRQDRSVN